HVQKRQFAKNNWLTDLRPFINDKSMAAPDLDFADFAKGGLQYAVESDGRVMSLPLNLDPWVVYWNKELFSAKAVAYPKTFAEMIDAAAKLNDPGKGGYGVVPAGPKQQVSALFADGEGISPFSKKKGPAWFYIQWASNKTNQTRMLQAAAGAPVRNSAYAAAQQSSDFKAPKEWVECMLKSASIAQPGLPIISPVTEFR